jgi:hypothetical protein
MMQSPYVSGASLNLSTTSQMVSIVIASKENIGALSQWKAAKIFKNLSLDTVSELVEQSETGRAFYYGKTGKWYMIPPLTNYSGYDRDNRKYLSDSQQVSKVVEQPEAQEELEETVSSEDLEVITQIINSGTPPVSFDGVRNSRKWDSKPSRPYLKQCLQELTERGVLLGNEKEGYQMP